MMIHRVSFFMCFVCVNEKKGSKTMIMNKEDFFKQLEFVGKTNDRRSTKDIRITPGDDGRFGFVFRNDITKLFGDGERIMVARFKNRMLFKVGDEGTALVRNRKNEEKGTRYCTFRDKGKDGWIALFAGDHDVKYDELYEYYYIDYEVK